MPITQMGTTELRQRLAERDGALAIYTDAYKNGMNLSAWLERLNPSDKDDQLDAFGRVLREAGILVRSNRDLGYWASPANEFLKPENRALFVEFTARTWRKISQAPSRRATYLTGDGTPGSWQRPYSEAEMARWDEDIAPAIPLSELVAITTPIEGQDYRTFYLTHSAEQVRLFRVGESDEIPIAKLADAEHTINLKKYGRGMRTSYEQMRRMRVDKLAMQIQRMAVQSEIDKVAAAIDIAVNGDGNANTAATNYDLTTLDSDATAGTLSLKGWLSFRKKFANPYILTTALMQEDISLQLELLNVGSANVMMVNLTQAGIFGSIMPINRTAQGVGYGWTSDAPANTIVGMDGRQSLELVTEIGGDIAETERFITNQTEVLIMTEVNGFATLDQNAANTLTVNA